LPAAQAASYTITNTPGWNLIAVQLTNTSGNNIKNVIPQPCRLHLKKIQPVDPHFEPVETYTANG